MDDFSILNPVWIELISMNVSRLMLWQFVRWFKLELTIHSLLNSSENKIITKMVRSDKCTELTSAAPIFRWSSPQSNFDWANCFIMSFIFNYLRVVLLLLLMFFSSWFILFVVVVCFPSIHQVYKLCCTLDCGLYFVSIFLFHTISASPLNEIKVCVCAYFCQNKWMARCRCSFTNWSVFKCCEFHTVFRHFFSGSSCSVSIL